MCLVSTLLITFVVVFVFNRPSHVFAATSPSLGVASTYAILSSTYTNTSITTINGDVGFTTPPAMDPLGTHINYGSSAPYNAAGVDQGIALSNLQIPMCDFTFGSITDLSLLPQPLIPGVYCTTGALSIGTSGITLSGAGTYIFRSTGAFTTVDNSQVLLTNNASACDIFWTPNSAVTLGANTTFMGTIIDDAGITSGADTIWSGLALAFGGTVTTDTNTITVPVCTIPVVPLPATFHVIKNVINGSGGTGIGTATSSDFSIYVKDNLNMNVAGSPAPGVSATGTLYTLASGTYVVSEDPNPMYIQSFGGDCDLSGSTTLLPGDDKTCIITNTDIPVVVTPSPSPIIINPIVHSNSGHIPFVVATVFPIVVAPVQVSLPVSVVSPPVATTMLVVLISPGFPTTGFSKQSGGLSWIFVVELGVFVFVATLLVLYIKKRAM